MPENEAESPELLSNRYLILEPIGEGGMGSVFRALDTKTGIDVAIKRLRPELCSRDQSRRRFIREAKVAQSLNHEGIVKILDQQLDKHPYIVMELITGNSLRKYIRKTKPTIIGLLGIFSKICEPLDYAHSHGVVHRDLKPDNIFVDFHEQIKILDFGLARFTDREMTAITRPGTALGTCTYMAPEQATGHEADARSDLYSIGIMLYEFLCGMTPFSADDSAAILYKQVNEEPEHPCAVNPNLSAEVGDLILWLMNKNPDLRPQSAHDLKNTIDKVIQYLRTGHVTAPVITQPVNDIVISDTEVHVPDDTIAIHPQYSFETKNDSIAYMHANCLNADKFMGKTYKSFYHNSNNVIDKKLDLDNIDFIKELNRIYDYAAKIFVGRIREYTDTGVKILFAGLHSCIRAYLAAEFMRQQMAILTAHCGINANLPIVAGIFVDNSANKRNSSSIDESVIKQAEAISARLCSMAIHGETYASFDESVPSPELECEFIRNIYVRGFINAIKVYKIKGVNEIQGEPILEGDPTCSWPFNS